MGLSFLKIKFSEMKSLLVSVCFLLITVNTGFSQTITTGTVTTPKCAGTTFNLTYSKSGTFTAGNVFTAQLSNATGSFTNPVNIGTLTSTLAGTIACTIPANTVSGTGYRVRVVSSRPARTGSVNNSNITINSNAISGSNFTCAGLTASFTTSVKFIFSSFHSSDYSIADGFSAFDSNNVSIQGISAGSCNISFSDINGCSTTFPFTVNSNPVLSYNSTAPLVSCLNSPFVLNGVGADSVYWSDRIVNNVPFIPNPFLHQSIISTHALPTSGSRWGQDKLFFTDLNGDGKIDCIGAEYNNGNPRVAGNAVFNVYQNSGPDNNIDNLNFTLYHTFACLDNEDENFYIQDVNNDGKLDILTACGVSINTSTITQISFDQNQNTSYYQNYVPNSMFYYNKGDFNGDGRVDSISGNILFQNYGTNNYPQYSNPITIPGLYNAYYLIDVDKDGDEEILYVKNYNEFGVLDFNGLSTQTDININDFIATNFTRDNPISNFEFFDFDLDGKKEIIERGPLGSSQILILKKENYNPVYTLTGTNQNGCKSTLDVIVPIIVFHPDLFDSDTLKICGKSFLLNARAGYNNYFWNTGDTGISVNVTASGLYKCKVSNVDCDAWDSIYINIFNSGIINNDTVICSGQYLNLKVNSTEQNSVLDIDGNLYNIVNIGLQSWMQRNLSVSRFRNGNAILNQTDSVLWENSPSAWCNYNNELQSNKNGKLYNWYAANDPSGLAPIGWHIPTSYDFSILSNFLGGDPISGGKLKDTGVLSWNYPNVGATNQASFFGYPSGARTDGFIYLGDNTSFWTTSSDVHDFGIYRNLRYNNSDFFEGGFFKNSGFSIRCIKDVPDTVSNFNYLWSNNSNAKNIIVNPTISSTYYCTVSNGIGTCRDSVKVTVNTSIPSAPLTIYGSTDVCSSVASNSVSAPVRYYVRKVTNATSYNWTVPTGATIVSGQGDTAIDVTFNSSFVSGVISVKSVNGCGSSTSARTLTVYKRTAAAPTAIQKEYSPVSIAAITNVCGLSSSVYRIKKVTYATSYNWYFNIGSNANITHVNSPGVNDTAVIVTFLSGFRKDTLSVKSISACNSSTAKTVILNATLLPPAVTTINGKLTPCIGEVVNYSATAAAPTTTQTSIAVYRWTKPNNTTIVSAASDSSYINLQFNTGFTGGSITAKGQSACGIAGTAKSVSLQYLTPTPTSITSSTGVYNACIGTPVTYTAVLPAPTTTQRAANVYRWTKPNNTTILSASADSLSITLQFNVGYIGGSLSVKGQTACGITGTAKTQALTHTACPTGTKINPITINKNENNFNVTIYPNPTSTDFNLKVEASDIHKQVSIKIRDVEGRLLKTIYVMPQQNVSFGSDLIPGVYMLEATDGYNKKSIRAVKY